MCESVVKYRRRYFTTLEAHNMQLDFMWDSETLSSDHFQANYPMILAKDAHTQKFIALTTVLKRFCEFIISNLAISRYLVDNADLIL